MLLGSLFVRCQASWLLRSALQPRYPSPCLKPGACRAFGQMCGAVAGELHPYDLTRKTRLHIGHIVDKFQGGTDDPSNLRAICSVCNEGASNLTLERPSSLKLLAQVRRAKGGDQVELLKWLVRKFPNQAEEFLDEKNT